MVGGEWERRRGERRGGGEERGWPGRLGTKHQAPTSRPNGIEGGGGGGGGGGRAAGQRAGAAGRGPGSAAARST